MFNPITFLKAKAAGGVFVVDNVSNYDVTGSSGLSTHSVVHTLSADADFIAVLVTSWIASVSVPVVNVDGVQNFTAAETRYGSDPNFFVGMYYLSGSEVTSRAGGDVDINVVFGATGGRIRFQVISYENAASVPTGVDAMHTNGGDSVSVTATGMAPGRDLRAISLHQASGTTGTSWSNATQTAQSSGDSDLRWYQAAQNTDGSASVEITSSNEPGPSGNGVLGCMAVEPGSGLVDGETLPAITSRLPAFYATLNGTGAATDESGNAIPIAETGSPSKGSDGWTLGAGVYLEADHDGVFETDDGTTRFGWVDSEVTVTFECAVSSLAAVVPLASKSDGSRFSNTWHLDAQTDGSLKLIAESSQGKTVIHTPASTVSTGTRHYIQIQFGREGLQLWVDGNSSSNGHPYQENWYGWDHRVRGGTVETLVNGQRWVNNHPLRLGHNGTSSAGEVQVRHWAVFVSGGTDYDPWVRTGTRLARADVEAIAGMPGTTDLDDYLRSGGNTINIATGDSAAARKAAIEGASSGDTIALATGSHTISDDLTIPPGVRMIGGTANKADTVLDLSGTAGKKVTGSGAAWLDLTLLDSSGTLSEGDYSISLTDTSGVAVDDIIVIISTVEAEFDWYGTTGEAAFRKRSDLVSVDSVSGSVVAFRQALRKGYTAAERAGDAGGGATDLGGVYRLRPAWKNNVFENMTILADAGVAATSTATTIPAMDIPGLVGCKFRNVEVRQVATETDQLCAKFECAVNLELVSSVFDSESPETDPAGAYHPYACNLAAGRDVRALGCEFDTDWADGLDSSYNNALQEVGTSIGIGDHIACHWTEQIDCTVTVGHPSIGIGGHDRTSRRVMCCTTNKGMTFSRGSELDETWGMICGYHQANLTAGSKGIHHDLAFSGGGDGIWKQFGGNRQKDSIFSEVRGSWSTDGSVTVTNCEFVNCDTPNPG